MIRIVAIGGALILWIYCIVDVLATKSRSMQSLPKAVWLPVVVLVPILGSIAWLLLGRPEGARLAPGSEAQRQTGPAAPDDSPEFLSRVSDDIRRRRLRDELRRLSGGDGGRRTRRSPDRSQPPDDAPPDGRPPE